MSRLGDLARRVLAGALVRECGLVGPRAPEPVPEPVRASMLAWADGAAPVAIGLDPTIPPMQWPRVHRPDGREPLTIWMHDEVAGLYDGEDVWATLRGKSDAMRRVRRMLAVDEVTVAIVAMGGSTRRALPPARHEVIQLGVRDDDGARTFAPPGDACLTCSDPQAGRWVPASACPSATARLDDEDAEHQAAIEGWRG